MSDRVVASVHVPIYFHFLAGRVGPTSQQARYLRSTEVYAGPFDGLKTHMPDMVDWSRSHVDLSPLVPWLGSPDESIPRKLLKRLCAKWPELTAQLEIIELEVEIIGGPYQWGDLIPVRAV